MLRDADAEFFVGREAALTAIRELIDPTTSSRILLVHGPGGIGKSALLRAAARIAGSDGFEVAAFDSRGLPPQLEAMLETVLPAARPGDQAPPFLVIDEVDHLGALLAPLRDALLDRLPETARVVLAGRAEPDQSWHSDGLPALVVDLPLGPLTDDDADVFLAQRGIRDPQRRARIVTWARGYPLALTVAASAPDGRPGDSIEAHLEERLTAWLAGRSMLDVDRETLEVAAVARAVDGRLLAAALPGRNTRELMPALQALPVMQRFGSGVSLHPVLADAIRDRLRVTAPNRYRTLVRRVAEHLGTRARLGDMDALVQMSLLIEDPVYRRSIGNEPSRILYQDRPALDELADYARVNGFDRGPDWAEIEAWVRTEPRVAFVLRRSGGEPVLWNAFARVADLPESGPVSASLRSAAQRIGVDPERSFAGVPLFASAPAEERAEASRLSSGAFMQASGEPELQAILMHFPEPVRHPGGVTTTSGYVVSDAGPRQVSVAEFRPYGAVGFVETIVLREQGFDPRTPSRADLLAPTDDPERRERLRAVLGEVFADTEDDRRLRAVIEAAHLGPRRSEAALRAEFHVGRSTWYRLLRAARERVLAHR